MKYAILFLLLVTISCNDESPDAQPPVTVKYEVITSEGLWFGEYIVQSGEKDCICSPPLGENGWTYSFEVNEIPFTLHIDATTEINFGSPGAPDVTTNIYVNDILVATNTSNWAPGVASADYVIEK